MYKPDGMADHYKAKFIAKGCTHTYSSGVDTLKTFSIVTLLNSICVLISVASNQGWQMFELDVKNTIFVWCS